MKEKDILQRTAKTVIDREMIIEIDVMRYSFIDKLLRRPKTRVFKVKRACLATLIYFSEQVLNLEEKAPEGISGIIDLILKDAQTLILVIAIFIENTDKEPSKNLIEFIKYNFDSTDCKATLIYLFKHNKVEDFISSIILIKEMSLLKTEEMIASEKIVSGELLGAH